MDNTFKVKYINCTENDMLAIGFDKNYYKQAINKHKFISLKIYNLNCAQANILKQTALSLGTDCAVHREVITGGINISNCILSGTNAELQKIAQKLKHQPFKLNLLGEKILSCTNKQVLKTIIKDKEIIYDKTYIMGILNITPNSFSDGGKFMNNRTAIEHFKKMVEEGANIIDIGGESTKPYAQAVTADEEISRVIPIIKEIRTFDKKTIISVDTRNAKTAQIALTNGADIINDVSGLEYDTKMLEVIKEYQCPIIINHSSGTPDTMQNKTSYDDVVETIYDFFSEKINNLLSNNIPLSKIILDPGIGFGKTTQQNFEIIKRIKEFKTLNCPILVGHSRKSFIQETIKSTDTESLDEATAILSGELIENSANIIRVHNVAKNKNVVKFKNLLT